MKLYQFLKWKCLTNSGGQAKHLISTGSVSVNGQIETRRGRRLIHGDLVSFGNIQEIFSDEDPSGRKLGN
ncbi:RNA-binding S4 domain-containing protein [Prochlorococcus marinus]|uniref:S4 domain n=1 Tax=Prochlorococcus marinus (strain MIT 9211) TaxID=93059 RepID=A9BAK8_PROM4|nr:RNA-binding S4 domain-containing protein [Prochlorococcus marinus]ABX08870.1 S4 domain [Prochlorococcus marinus str. MIT 9211]